MAFAVASLLACTQTPYETVAVSGIPRCENEGSQGQVLTRAIVVELASGSMRTRQIFTGFSGDTRPPDMSVPDERREYQAQFGLCRNRRVPASAPYHCGDVDWYERTSMTIDPSEPEAAIRVPTPPEGACGP
jgi:hypothetical protein